jgi:MoxR-like ATPase
LLEAMQERQSTVDGETRPLPDPFLVMATQNPIEMEGTFPLPEAQLDRFMVRIKLGYPTPEEESDILLRFERDSVVDAIDAVTDGAELGRIQRQVTEVRVDDTVREYIVAIAQASRENQGLMLGASPRGAMAMYKTAQATAAIDGRDFVTPDDVKAVVPHVLPHRMVLTSTARLRGRSTENVVREIMASVPVPIER